jgi:hypothetical protein
LPETEMYERFSRDLRLETSHSWRVHPWNHFVHWREAKGEKETWSSYMYTRLQSKTLPRAPVGRALSVGTFETMLVKHTHVMEWWCPFYDTFLEACNLLEVSQDSIIVICEHTKTTRLKLVNCATATLDYNVASCVRLLHLGLGQNFKSKNLVLRFL